MFLQEVGYIIYHSDSGDTPWSPFGFIPNFYLSSSNYVQTKTREVSNSASAVLRLAEHSLGAEMGISVRKKH